MLSKTCERVRHRRTLRQQCSQTPHLSSETGEQLGWQNSAAREVPASMVVQDI